MQDVMFDLETYGVRPDAAVLSIGAVLFDERDLGSELYTSVSLESCLLAGLTKDQSTIDWWDKQEAHVRAAWQDEQAKAPLLIDALTALSGWLRDWCDPKSVRVWANGASFDLPILESAYRAVGADAPWAFWNHRCHRTMKNLAPGVEVERLGTWHHALDDAKHQARQLQAVLAHLGLRLS